MPNRFLFALACIFSSAVQAQTQSWECNYPTFSDGTTVKRSAEKFALTFILDEKKDSAYIVGNNGSNPVVWIPSGDGPTFIETTTLGNVMTTAINKKGQSVHSRATRMLGGELVASQYYGTCLRK